MRCSALRRADAVIFCERRIYVDTRLHHMLQLNFNEPFFKRGDFPGVVQNNSEAVILTNPWINGTNAAPFDQRTLSLRCRACVCFDFLS